MIKVNRHSLRLKGYDYASPGAYFITLVTWQREDLFGNIMNDEMVLSPLGKIAHDEWLRSTIIRNEIHLFEDEFIVMPNHLHGILWIVASSPAKVDSDYRNDGIRTDRGASLAPLQRKPKSLSSFIAGYKSSVTSRARNELKMTNVWQRNYYDHIIRNVDDLKKIWNYIDTNVRIWNDDELQHKINNM